MSCKDDTTKSKNYKQLTLADRNTIKRMLLAGSSQADIARALNVARSTISREIKRGKFVRRQQNPKISKDPAVPEYVYTWIYEAEEANRRRENNKLNCGAKNIILECSNLVEFIEDKVLSSEK